LQSSARFGAFAGLKGKVSGKNQIIAFGNGIGIARGGAKRQCHPKFLENLAILCFEWRFSEENSVFRLKSNILPPPNFSASYATGNGRE